MGGDGGAAEQKAYRTAPYTIQAACAGDVDSLKHLANAGCDVGAAVGHICLSRRRQNTVASNAVGAAAYWGHAKVLGLALASLDMSAVNFEAIESADKRPSKGSAY